MNNIEAVLTRNVTIVLLLNEYDFRYNGGIDVEVNTGFERRYFHIYSDDLDKVRESRRFKINYESIDLFDFDALEIKCKYPTRVYCNKYTIGYIRGIRPAQEEK